MRNLKSSAGSLGRARELRRESTDAERMLWQHLRGRQLAGLKFRRQHTWGGYVLDLYCPEAALAIELDGGQHAEAANKARDAVRESLLEANGIAVLRFWDNEVLSHTEDVLETIRTAALGRLGEKAGT